MQARFNISVVARESDTALSNAALAGSKRLTSQPGRVLHTFRMTPPMSTYLCAVIVGPLASVGGSYKQESGAQVAVRVWGRQTRTSFLQFALDVAVKAMQSVPFNLS